MSYFMYQDTFPSNYGLMDNMIDKGIDLQRIFGPRSSQQPLRPPPISVGEITSSKRRDVGALELITRFREQQQRGQTSQAGGLAWYTPTGLVRYAVVAPDQSRILWQGNLGRIAGIAQMTPHQREVAIRRLITQETGQAFRNLPEGHGGADLIPTNRFTDFDDAIDVAIDYVITPERRLFNCSCSIWGQNPNCNLLHRTGQCAGSYTGIGRTHAECMRNARLNAPAQCRGCLKHCGLVPRR